MEVAGPRLHIRPMTGLPLLHVEEPEFAGARRVVKGGRRPGRSRRSRFVLSAAAAGRHLRPRCG